MSVDDISGTLDIFKSLLSSFGDLFLGLTTGELAGLLSSINCSEAVIFKNEGIGY